MPQGSATTARHQGALSAHNRFVPLGARYVPASSYRRPEPGHWKLAATDLEYEVTRVKSPVLGRDLNPMGRGDGTYYCNGGNLAVSGSLAIRGVKPVFVGVKTFGYGNDVNNYLSNDQLSQRVERAQGECGLEIATCPTLFGQWFREDACENLNLDSTYVFCCICLPATCPEGNAKDCHWITGCVITAKRPEWYELCGRYPDDCAGWCRDEARQPGYCKQMVGLKPRCVAKCIAKCVIDCERLKAAGNWNGLTQDDTAKALDACCGRCVYQRY